MHKMMLMRPSSLSDKYRRAMRYEQIKWMALKPMAMMLFSKIYVRDDARAAERHGQVEAPSSMEELASVLVFKHLVMDACHEAMTGQILSQSLHLMDDSTA